jgi:Ca-activated chloride channel family protein
MKNRHTYNLFNSVLVTGLTLIVTAVLFFSIWNYLDKNVPEFRFENPKWLWTLLTLPILSAIFITYQWWQNKAIQNLADSSLLPSAISSVSPFNNRNRFVQMYVAFFALIIAVANPQYGKTQAEAKQRGSELMIALDISNSMLAEDQSGNMNRLKAAKLAINRILPALTGNKLGIVVFAGEAYTQVPMTNDYGALKLFLNPVDPSYISHQGTAIGAAIETSLKSFSPSFKGSKAIIIISDGENHEDDAVELARMANNQGVNVHTIGIGNEKGSPIPYYENGVKKGLRKDELGNTVLSRLNEDMLREVSQAGHGIYMKANNARFGLEELIEKIKGMKKEEYAAVDFAVYEDQFMLFLLIAFFCFLIDPIFYFT